MAASTGSGRTRRFQCSSAMSQFRANSTEIRIRVALAAIDDAVAERAEGKAGQRVRLDPYRNEDGAVLLEPAIGALELALAPHRRHLLCGFGAPAEEQIDIARRQL